MNNKKLYYSETLAPLQTNLSSDTVKLTILQVLSQLFLFARSVYVFRFIGESGFGVITILTSYQFINFLVAFPGTQFTLPRSIKKSDYDNKSLLSTKLLWILMTSVSTLAIITFYIHSVDNTSTEIVSEYYWEFIIFILFSTIVNYYRLILNIYEFQLRVGIINLIISSFDAILSSYLVTDFGIKSLVVSITFANFIGFLVLQKLIFPYLNFKLFFKNVKDYLSLIIESRYYWLSNILLYLSQFIAIYLLTIFTNSFDIGLYSLGKIVSMPITQLVLVLPSILLPRFANLQQQGHDLIEIANEFSHQIFTRLLFAIIAILMIIPIFYQYFYQGIDTRINNLASLMIITASLSFFEILNNMILISKEDDKFLVSISIIKRLIGLVLMIIFINQFGVIGLVVSELITVLIVIFLQMKKVGKLSNSTFIYIIGLISILTLFLILDNFLIFSILNRFIALLILIICYLLIDRKFIFSTIFQKTQ